VASVPAAGTEKVVTRSCPCSLARPVLWPIFDFYYPIDVDWDGGGGGHDVAEESQIGRMAVAVV
jgi:hypothetical protein